MDLTGFVTRLFRSFSTLTRVTARSLPLVVLRARVVVLLEQNLMNAGASIVDSVAQSSDGEDTLHFFLGPRARGNSERPFMAYLQVAL